MNYAETDVRSDAFQGPFGQSRTWVWKTGRDYGQHIGNGWMNASLPTARRYGSNVQYINGEGLAMTFKTNGYGTFPTFDDQSSLVTDAMAGELILTDELGNVTVFYDYAPGITPVERVGQMKRHTDRSGVVTQVMGWTAQGAATEVRRTQGTIVESWQYTYGSTLATSALQTSILVRRSTDGGNTFTPVQAVEYTYYGLDDPNGNRNDLRSATVRTGGLTGPVERTSYYRYYLPDDPKGYPGQLKHVVTDEAFDRLAAAYGQSIATIDTLTDAQLTEYASRYYEYNAQGKAVKAAIQGGGCSSCAGGRGEFDYVYTRNPRRAFHSTDGTGDQNVWDVVTDETLPDGNTKKVFTNTGGQVMLSVFTETATGVQREEFAEFDYQGRVVRTADSVAVNGYDVQYDDLLNKVNGNYQYLSDTDGAIVESKYGTATTATATTPGDVLGYLRGTQVRRGELGMLASPLSRQTYYLRTGAGKTIYPIATTTQFPNDRSPTPLFADDFSAAAAGPAWTFVGAGGWQQTGGVLSQTNTSSYSYLKQAHLASQSWDSTQEIVSSMRIDSWAININPWAAAGIGVRGNVTDGPYDGYSLMFRQAGLLELTEGTGGAVSRVPFNWTTGTWYRMRLRVEDNVLSGKVWAVGQPEPIGWMVSVNLVAAGWILTPGGNPYLLGGMSWGPAEHMNASFDDVQVSNVGLPVGETTTSEYAWSGTYPLQPTAVTITMPLVEAGQNGPGVPYAPDKVTTVLDANGRAVWIKDASGFLHFTQYDPATGAVLKTITDVNHTQTADFTALPAGWTTPAGGGKHLKTVNIVDMLGRLTKTTYPNGAIDHFTYDDATEAAKTYPGWTGTTTTGPVQLVRRDRVGGDVIVESQTIRYTYVETLTYVPTSIPVNSGQPTGVEAVSNIQSLSRDYFNQSGQLVWRDNYFNLTGLSYLDAQNKPVFALGTEGTHFLRTRMSYDKQGRPSRV